jgi:hypothetical protein
MIFYVGLHMVNHCGLFDNSFVSVNRLRNRQYPFFPRNWIMDSGAFTEISQHGRYRYSEEQYVSEIERWKNQGNLICAVTQDYMCEPFILSKTGLTIPKHQELTIERYLRIISLTRVPIMPVIQGYDITDYVNHVRMYGDILIPNSYVGVGSVCKRNTDPFIIQMILGAIKKIRPDLRLHGFGLKETSLTSPNTQRLLHSADSMAWSFAARRENRDANSWKEAKRFEQRITQILV